jgi:hypothetical protein
MTTSLIPLQRIERKILLIRGQKVLLDSDLAELYGVTTKRLNEQVKRNADRFPKHFMFQLTDQEFANWRSQIATSNPGAKMGLRRPPYAFTEHGTLQAANVLNSKAAIKVGILVIEAFLKLRDLTANQSAIIKKLTEHEKQIGYLFQLMEELAAVPQEGLYKTHKIGFLREEDTKSSKGKRRAKS